MNIEVMNVVDANITVNIDITIYGIPPEDFKKLNNKIAGMLEDYIENILFDYEMIDFDISLEARGEMWEGEE